MTKCSRLYFIIWIADWLFKCIGIRVNPDNEFWKYSIGRLYPLLPMRYLTTFIIFLVFQLDLAGQTFGGASKIFTDFNGFWSSGVGEINTSVKPNNRHNVLAYTWRGVTYSTGVNDPRLVSSGVNFSPEIYQAFPVRNIGSTSGTYIGLGQLHDGVNGGISSPPPFNVPPNLGNFLTDGLQGLDIGTGVANIKAGELIFDFTGIIDQNQIADGIPDIMVSQIADPSSTTDEIYMADGNGNKIGNSISINHVNIGRVGSWTADFYNLSGTSAAFINGERDLRLWVGELRAFGINNSNYQLVKSMRYKLNGSSDPAFAAFKVGVFDILSANNDLANTDQAQEVEINVMQNDQPFLTLDPSTVHIVKAPANGTLNINYTTGNIVYTPNPDFSGTDTFTYEVCSNQSEFRQCDEAIVELSVRSVILPISLMDFSAYLVEENQVKISWTTTGELGNDYFEIQRSTNGRDWEIIQKEPGAGYSNGYLQYTWLDPFPREGYNYYRLRQVDLNGQDEIFEVVSVKLPIEEELQVKIYPNPSGQFFSVEADAGELDHILIFNPYGQILNAYIKFSRISDTQILVDMQNLPTGVYVVKTKISGHMIRKFF